MAGRKGSPRSPKTKKKISKSQKARFANPWKAKMHRHGIQKSYDSGKLAKYKVQWTAEMDAKLAELCSAHGRVWLRDKGTRVIGVSYAVLWRRVKELNLPVYDDRKKSPNQNK